MTSDMLSWLRQQIETRKALAEEAHGASWALRDRLVERLDGGADDRVALVDADDRTELISVTVPSPDLDEDDLAHIAFNDPRQIIADCEADLTLLEPHATFDFPHNPDDGPGDYSWTARCDGCAEPAPCSTVRLLASGYRNRPGYLPEWAPEGAA